jgi:hypothetical protein
MDRGIPSEAILQEMRKPERPTFYWVGTPKGRIHQQEKKWLDLPWHKVRDSVEVKLYPHEGELHVLAKTAGRQAKEIAMRRKRLARLLRKLRAMRKSLPKRDQLLLRIGAAKKEAGRAFGCEDPNSASGPAGHARDILVSSGPSQAEGRPTTLRVLSAAQQSHRGRSGGVVGALCATDADRECVSLVEERTVASGPFIVN